MYALLARLEKPLYRETAASIRQLYRRCCALRYALSKTSTSVAASDAPGNNTSTPSSADAFQSRLALLNMLISICGSYFGQGEEYDAFNRALAGEDGESGNENEESGNDEDDEDEYWEEEGEEGGEYEVEVDGEECGGADAGGAAQGWVAVSTVVEDHSGSSRAASSSKAGRMTASASSSAGAGKMDLEEGEEEEEADGACEDAAAGAVKKSRV